MEGAALLCPCSILPFSVVLCQAVNQSINISTKPSNCQSIIHSINHLVNSIEQSSNQSVNKSINQSITRTINRTSSPSSVPTSAAIFARARTRWRQTRGSAVWRREGSGRKEGRRRTLMNRFKDMWNCAKEDGCLYGLWLEPHATVEG